MVYDYPDSQFTLKLLNLQNEKRPVFIKRSFKILRSMQGTQRAFHNDGPWSQF